MTIYDNFRKKWRLVTFDQISPNGKWQKIFGGPPPWETTDTSSQGVTDRGIFHTYPYIAVYSGNNTDSSMTVSTQTFTNFDLTFQMRTKRALKTTFQQVWETAWLFWHYNENGHDHSVLGAFLNYYYMHIDTNGHIQVNRKDSATIDQTRFLAGTFGQEPTLTWNYAQWYKIRLRHEGNHIQLWVDDVLKFDKVDDGTLIDEIGTIPAPSARVSSGKFALYTEDAEAEYKPLDITVI